MWRKTGLKGLRWICLFLSVRTDQNIRCEWMERAKTWCSSITVWPISGESSQPSRPKSVFINLLCVKLPLFRFANIGWPSRCTFCSLFVALWPQNKDLSQPDTVSKILQRRKIKWPLPLLPSCQVECTWCLNYSGLLVSRMVIIIIIIIIIMTLQ